MALYSARLPLWFGYHWQRRLASTETALEQNEWSGRWAKHSASPVPVPFPWDAGTRRMHCRPCKRGQKTKSYQRNVCGSLQDWLIDPRHSGQSINQISPPKTVVKHTVLDNFPSVRFIAVVMDKLDQNTFKLVSFKSLMKNCSITSYSNTVFLTQMKLKISVWEAVFNGWSIDWLIDLYKNPFKFSSVIFLDCPWAKPTTSYLSCLINLPNIAGTIQDRLVKRILPAWRNLLQLAVSTLFFAVDQVLPEKRWPLSGWLRCHWCDCSEIKGWKTSPLIELVGRGFFHHLQKEKRKLGSQIHTTIWQHQSNGTSRQNLLTHPQDHRMILFLRNWTSHIHKFIDNSKRKRKNRNFVPSRNPKRRNREEMTSLDLLTSIANANGARAPNLFMAGVMLGDFINAYRFMLVPLSLPLPT